jgi:hypothetical protein
VKGQFFALPDDGIMGLALGGDGDGHGVERQLVEKFIAHFRRAAVDGLYAVRLGDGAVLPIGHGRGDADITHCRPGILLAEGWLIGFPAEAAQ